MPRQNSEAEYRAVFDEALAYIKKGGGSPAQPFGEANGGGGGGA